VGLGLQGGDVRRGEDDERRREGKGGRRDGNE